jgi:hypothetical protein
MMFVQAMSGDAQLIIDDSHPASLSHQITNIRASLFA